MPLFQVFLGRASYTSIKRSAYFPPFRLFPSVSPPRAFPFRFFVFRILASSLRRRSDPVPAPPSYLILTRTLLSCFLFLVLSAVSVGRDTPDLCRLSHPSLAPSTLHPPLSCSPSTSHYYFSHGFPARAVVRRRPIKFPAILCLALSQS